MKEDRRIDVIGCWSILLVTVIVAVLIFVLLFYVFLPLVEPYLTK